MWSRTEIGRGARWREQKEKMRGQLYWKDRPHVRAVYCKINRALYVIGHLSGDTLLNLDTCVGGRSDMEHDCRTSTLALCLAFLVCRAAVQKLHYRAGLVGTSTQATYLWAALRWKSCDITG